MDEGWIVAVTAGGFDELAPVLGHPELAAEQGLRGDRAE